MVGLFSPASLLPVFGAHQVVPRNAALAQTLDAATSTATGTVIVSAVLTKTLGAATLVATGHADVTGSLAQTLGAATLAATGSDGILADLAQTLGALTVSAVSDVDVAGALAQTLGAATSSATGTVIVSAGLTKTLGTATSTATGTVIVSAGMSPTLAPATLAAAAMSGDACVLAVTLDAATLTALGDIDIAVSASPTLGDLTTAATGEAIVNGTVSVTLGPLGITASGLTISIDATLSQTLGDLSLAAAGAPFRPRTYNTPIILSTNAQANSCIADGSIVVGGIDNGIGFIACYWDVDNAIHYLYDPDHNSFANGVNVDGTVIVGNGPGGGGYWSGDLSTTFTVLSGANTVRDCSDDGTVIVGTTSVGGQQRAAYWTNGVKTTLPNWPGTTGSGLSGVAEAMACNFDGSIIAGYAFDNNNIRHAVMWTGGVLTEIGLHSRFGSKAIAYGVSNDGTKIVGVDPGTASNDSYGFLRESGTTTLLPRFTDPGDTAEALGISADGSIICGDGNSPLYPSSGISALYWDSDTVKTLPAPVPDLGPELITNGGFVGGTTGWIVGLGWVYGSNNITFDPAIGTADLEQDNISFSPGNASFRLTLTVSGLNPTDGSAYIQVSSDNMFGSFSDQISQNGDGVINKNGFDPSTFTPTPNVDNIIFTVIGQTPGDPVTISNISLKTISGSDGSQFYFAMDVSDDGTTIVGSADMFGRGSEALKWTLSPAAPEVTVMVPSVTATTEFSDFVGNDIATTILGVSAVAEIPPIGQVGMSLVLPSVRATGEAGSVSLAGVPGDRTFIIAGIPQRPIPPGIVLLPTSENISLGPNPYIIASSQLYTIGEVHWNGSAKVEGTHWEFVAPFKHIIKILNTSGITTQITVILYRWNIGVRTGFKVNSYPVPFGFSGTTIIAERSPPPNQFFAVQYTVVRPGDNPRSMFAIFPNMVDDMLESHLLYDGESGFQTFRPIGYKVFDTSDKNVWEWDGAAWISLGPYPDNTYFYVKRLRQVIKFANLGLSVAYTAGDGASSIEEVISDSPPRVYPPFGESIAYNFLVDAFSPNAAVDYPSAYEVAQHPGDYDEWVPGIDS